MYEGNALQQLFRQFQYGFRLEVHFSFTIILKDCINAWTKQLEYQTVMAPIGTLVTELVE